jgi:hypothetical protein
VRVAPVDDKDLPKLEAREIAEQDPELAGGLAHRLVEEGAARILPFLLDLQPLPFGDLYDLQKDQRSLVRFREGDRDLDEAVLGLVALRADIVEMRPPNTMRTPPPKNMLRATSTRATSFCWARYCQEVIPAGGATDPKATTVTRS